MFCSKCGSKLDDDAIFCANCGAKVQMGAPKEASVAEPIHAQVDNFDEALVKAYIGPNADKMYDKLTTGKFSIWGLLFGAIYLVYRKLYLEAFLTILCTGLINYILGSSYSLSIGIIVALLFNGLYRNKITKQIAKIREENPNATKDELIQIASKKGGVSILWMSVLIVLYVIMIMILILLLMAL